MEAIILVITTFIFIIGVIGTGIYLIFYLIKHKHNAAGIAIQALEKGDVVPAMMLFRKKAESHLAEFHKSQDPKRDTEILKRYPGLSQTALDLMRCQELDRASEAYRHAATLQFARTPNGSNWYADKALKLLDQSGKLCPFTERDKVAADALKVLRSN